MNSRRQTNPESPFQSTPIDLALSRPSRRFRTPRRPRPLQETLPHSPRYGRRKEAFWDDVHCPAYQRSERRLRVGVAKAITAKSGSIEREQDPKSKSQASGDQSDGNFLGEANDALSEYTTYLFMNSNPEALASFRAARAEWALLDRREFNGLPKIGNWRELSRVELVLHLLFSFYVLLRLSFLWGKFFDFGVWAVTWFIWRPLRNKEESYKTKEQNHKRGVYHQIIPPNNIKKKKKLYF